MNPKKRGGDTIPDSIKTGLDFEKFLNDADSTTLSKQHIVFAKKWFQNFKTFSSLWNGKDYFKPPETIAPWCYRQKNLFLEETLPPWKMDLLTSIDFKKYCLLQPIYKSPTNNQPQSSHEAKLLIGEKSINRSINSTDLHTIQWLKDLDSFVKHQATGESHKVPKHLVSWVRTNKKRFVAKTLPSWKQNSLKEIEFDKFIVNTGLKLAQYVEPLLAFYKNSQSFQEHPKKPYKKLYKWRDAFVPHASKNMIELFLSLVPALTPRQRTDFLDVRQRPIKNEFYTEQERKQFAEESFKIIQEQNIAFEKRFATQTFEQTKNILYHLSQIKTLTPMEYEALAWLNQFSKLVREVNNQGLPIIELELNKADHFFLRLTRNGFMKNQLFSWQLKYLAEIDFKSYVEDEDSSSFLERNLRLLKAHHSKFGTVLVEETNKEFDIIYKWRQRMSRAMRKIPEKKWPSKPMFFRVKDALPEVGMDEWRQFFLTPTSNIVRKRKLLTSKVNEA